MKAATWDLVKKLLFLPPLAVGVLVLVVLVARREPPRRSGRTEKPRAVRVIAVPSLAAVPRALGYGEAQPGTVWQAVAEVSGKVIETAARLKKGAFLSAGSTLVRIDPTAYELAIAGAQAEIERIQAELKELALREGNYRASLDLEAKSLEFAEKERGRKQALLKRGVISQSDYEEEERAVLTQRSKMQTLKNSLKLVPAQRQVLEAQLAVARVRLSSARLDLEHSTIKAPFNIRIAEVNVEQAQFVQKGQALAVADSMDVAEVAAQFTLQKFMQVMRPAGDAPLKLPPMSERELRALAERSGVSATVRLRAGSMRVEWDAKLVRVDSVIAPKTRTVGVIVAVERPYEQVQLGLRPPLVKGMYCEVELRGKPRPDSLVVPRSALQGTEGHFSIFVVGKGNRLERRDIEVEFVQADFALVSAGLEAGEQLVITDLIPAIPGMLLAPQVDEAATAALVAAATGKTPAR